MNIVNLIDTSRSPTAVNTDTVSAPESTLVESLDELGGTVDIPERVMDDKSNDDDKLNQQQNDLGVELISPRPSNLRQEGKTQEGCRIRGYRRR
jgi:hypothetical protein